MDDTADDHLDALLKTLIAKEQETGGKVDTDVITWRGMMTKVCCRDQETLQASEH
jgi:RAT1-interacting protein